MGLAVMRMAVMCMAVMHMIADPSHRIRSLRAWTSHINNHNTPDSARPLAISYFCGHRYKGGSTMTYRTAMLALMCVGVSGLAVAQTTPSQDTPRYPNESPTTSSSATAPADTSKSHQAMNNKSHEQMMKDCVAKERSQNTSMSKEAAQKTCKDQMKSMSTHQ
jgi:hypothetical protein